MAETPPSRWPRSVRSHLLVIVAALGIPLLGIQWWTTSHAMDGALESVQGTAVTKSEGIAGHIQQYLGMSEALLTRSPVEQASSALLTGDCTSPAFTREGNRLFTTLTVLRTDSEIVCSSRPLADSDPSRHRALVERTVAARAFQVGAVVTGTVTGEPVLPVGAPILDDGGNVTGVLIGSLPLADNPLLAHVELDPSELVTIATEDGVIIARWPDHDVWFGTRVPRGEQPFTEVAPGQEVGLGVDLDGIERVWAQTDNDYGWTIFVGLPIEGALRPAVALARREFGFVLVLILLAGGLAMASYRRIRVGLDELSARIRAEPGAPVPELSPGTPSEVADVIGYLDEVARSRDRAREGERHAVARYHALFDNGVFGVGTTTRDGRFIEANAALAEILGYESPAALVEAGPLAVHRSPEARNAAIDAIPDGVFQELDSELIRADGSPIQVRIDGRVYTDPSGERIVEGIVQDVSEQRLAEARLRQSQKMEAVGQLAGGIAHDFNNLLTAIGGSLELMEAKLGESSSVEADIAHVREAADRASALTRQLLAFARRDQGEVGPVDLHAVLIDSERLLKRLIGEHIILSTHFGSEPCHVAIEADELQQVVMNLVLNSRDALPEGGRVTIATERQALDDRDGVRLIVSDGGLGMNEETQNRLFEPFYSTKRAGEGTGLGMSIVYGIVHRAEGHIDVESAPFKGTTVRIWLPTEAARERPPAKREEFPAPSGGDEHILIVEDDNNVRLFVQRALVEVGYRVTAERDGKDALQRASELDQPADLVLTDVVMPHMSGTDLGQELRSLWPSTPVLYMSGYTYEHDLKVATSGDPKLLLRKPFRAHELCARVREVLDQYAHR